MEASDIIITPVLMSQFDFNTALFLKRKFETETNYYEKWRLLYNGYDKRFDEFKGSSQKDYREIFEKEFDNLVPFDCCLPWTTQIRRYIDRNEKINPTKNFKLWNAITNLAYYVTGEKDIGTQIAPDEGGTF
jgi:hypothetical protein